MIIIRQYILRFHSIICYTKMPLIHDENSLIATTFFKVDSCRIFCLNSIFVISFFLHRF